MVPQLRTYEEFWPYYVSEHRKPATRALHFLGTSLVLATLAAAAFLSPWWLLATPFAGYGPAWLGHFLVEKNRPLHDVADVADDRHAVDEQADTPPGGSGSQEVDPRGHPRQRRAQDRDEPGEAHHRAPQDRGGQAEDREPHDRAEGLAHGDQ